MKINLTLSRDTVSRWLAWADRRTWTRIIVLFSIILSVTAIIWSYRHDAILAYGDAESHLNIAKRVVHSLTPGLAQLGGIWLPLPHVLMLPLVYFDTLWRTGLAGSIVSGIAFVISAVFLYRLAHLITNHKLVSLVAPLLFMTNPNILYLQTTPLTELPLMAFFVLNSYYFIRHLKDRSDLLSLILAAFFGFCATLSRYDGWFLVALEAVALALRDFSWKRLWPPVSAQSEGRTVLFSTLAFFGIALWLLWGYLILGNPLYFTSSQFSAKSQQRGWLAKGQLPSYRNLGNALAYYSVVSAADTGLLIFACGLIGLVLLIKDKQLPYRRPLITVLFTPFIFYVITLYMGQSLIFVPSLTPVGFEWRLFNVRYGVMMVPVISVMVAYLVSRARLPGRLLIGLLVVLQFGLYAVGYSPIYAYKDGTVGLSSARRPDAERWLAANYDTGLIIIDDYSRIFSVIRAHLPMQNIIYIGTHPYWEESLAAPWVHARWLVIQKGDELWKAFYETEDKQARLYTYFEKAYTSEEILVFRRQPQYD